MNLNKNLNPNALNMFQKAIIKHLNDGNKIYLFVAVDLDNPEKNISFQIMTGKNVDSNNDEIRQFARTLMYNKFLESSDSILIQQTEIDDMDEIDERNLYTLV